MNKLLLVLLAMVVSANTQAQFGGKPGGIFSLGQRTTLSAFNSGHGERSALGIGGQFRIRLSDRVNTEWFADYLPATNDYTRRQDYHIGWSVMYYPLNTKGLVMPYVLAGHCFDYTKHVDLSNRSNNIDRWSSAVQVGLGTHFNLTERLDISLSSQYMIHLGNEVHSHIEEEVVTFEEHKGGSLEGHLLFTLSFNYQLVDLWSRD